MVIDFKGKHALVTGGAGGIGMAVTKELLGSGARVTIADVSQKALEAAAEELADLGLGEFHLAQVDITDTDSIRTCVEAAVRDYRPIEVLIQTAGILRGQQALDITQKDWDLVMNINARGMFFMMQQVVEQSMQHTGGAIVNFASMAGIRGMRAEMASAHYSASKGAVVAMTMQAATEWAKYGIRANAVAPGGVITKAMLAMKGDAPEDPHAMDPIPLRKLSMPQNIADAVVFLASSRAEMITGQTLVIDGGSSIVGY